MKKGGRSEWQREKKILLTLVNLANYSQLFNIQHNFFIEI